MELNLDIFVNRDIILLLNYLKGLGYESIDCYNDYMWHFFNASTNHNIKVKVYHEDKEPIERVNYFWDFICSEPEKRPSREQCRKFLIALDEELKNNYPNDNTEQK